MMSESREEGFERHRPMRWRVLAAITAVGPSATVDRITDEVHERRSPDDPVAGLESWDRTHQRLHEVDLPALDAAGLIRFDDERGVVTVPPEASTGAIGTPDRTGQERSDGTADRNWRYLYLGAAVLSAGVVVATASFVSRDGLAMTVVATGVVALFALLALAQSLTADSAGVE